MHNNFIFLKIEIRQKIKRMDGQEKRMKKRQEDGARRTRVRQGVFLALRRTIKRKKRRRF